MTELISLKKRLNEKYKKLDSLRVYFRFANQYLCKKFTDDFTSDKLNIVQCSLTLPLEEPSEYKEMEPHSQSV